MKTLDALKLLDKQTSAEVYLVGGFVRDFLRGVRNSDLDVVVRKASEEEIISFLTRYGKVKKIALSKTNDGFVVETILFRGRGGQEAQITLPRRGKKQIVDQDNTLRQDSKCRDFKVNALYLPINSLNKKSIIDSVEGKKDSSDKLISPVLTSAECIEASPIRMMRAISLAAHTGYSIDGEFLATIKEKASLILRVPPEAVRKEFNRILLSKKPSRYFRLLHTTGLLAHISPELERCVGVIQDIRYHKYDVFTHLIYTVNNLEQDLVLRLAGLLHDVGKPDTREETTVNGEVHISFHKHELSSVYHTKSFLDRLRYDSTTKEEVLNLVRLHMYHYTREYTDTAIKRFIKKAGITEKDVPNLSKFPLFKLRIAERKGNGFKKEGITQRQLDFERRITEAFARGAGIEAKDLEINGHILMEIFGLTSGKYIGHIIQYLLDKVRDDRTLNERTKLVELALAFIKHHEPPKN